MYPIEFFWRSVQRYGDRVALASPIISWCVILPASTVPVESLRTRGKDIR